MKMNLIKVLVPALAAGILLQGCVAGGDNPGVEYAPDMYVSKAYEPMTQVEGKAYQLQTITGRTVPLTKDGKTMREPVKGTISTDMNYIEGLSKVNNYLDMQYGYANTPQGKDSASKMLKNPVALTELSLASGKRLYNINCAPCHGVDGLGKGPVSVKFPPNNIPSYKSGRVLALTDGGVYHVITYGQNLMGSYASVLTPEQRWEVIHYVNYLKTN